MLSHKKGCTIILNFVEKGNNCYENLTIIHNFYLINNYRLLPSKGQSKQKGNRR